MSVQNLIFTM